MQSVDDRPLWACVALLERATVERWRVAYASNLDTEQALTQRVTTVETHVERRLAGNVSVTVSILARRAHEGTCEYFKLQRSGNRMYRVVEPDSTSTKGLL